MNLLSWISIILGTLYGGLTAIGGMVQVRVREIPLWSAIAMTITGLAIFTSSLLIFSIPKMLILNVSGLLLLYFLSIINGIHLFGKINIRHNATRLFISMIIFAFLLKTVF